jgi:DNA-binding MarR family transcriptional regulator
MSRRLKNAKRQSQNRKSGPPYFGALLRISWQQVRKHMLEAIQSAGYTDIQDAHLAAFSYPPPDGVRPSELAHQMRMSRQAANHVINQLERLGYLERQAAIDGKRRLIYLTKRGHGVVETIYASLRKLQNFWADRIGHEQFNTFVDVLTILSDESFHGSSAQLTKITSTSNS